MRQNRHTSVRSSWPNRRPSENLPEVEIYWAIMSPKDGVLFDKRNKVWMEPS